MARMVSARTVRTVSARTVSAGMVRTVRKTTMTRMVGRENLFHDRIYSMVLPTLFHISCNPVIVIAVVAVIAKVVIVPVVAIPECAMERY